jgi:putative nucleotidyltransferase with HDIG domain
MDASQDRRILFVVDEAGLASNSETIRDVGGVAIDVAALTPDIIARHRLVAVDVDLTHNVNVRRLRSILSHGRQENRFQAFAIDLSRRLETVYAHIIGATDLTRRPFQKTELLARIAAFEEAAQARGTNEAAAASITLAATALGDMFEALTFGSAVKMPTVVSAGAEIVEAIGDVGFPTWVEAVRHHHEGTFQHCLIVTGLASSFGRATGMSRADTITLTTAGLLHDIGKAAVPVSILDKPGQLTAREFEIIQTHPVRGYEHLAGQEGIDPDVLAAVRSHHEYLDGSGYPDKLVGSNIGDLTRILTICDVYGAMIERRAYKPPKSSAEAMAAVGEMADAGKLERPLVRAFHQAVAA